MILPSLLTTNPRIAQERINAAQHMSGWLHIDLLDKTLYPYETLSITQLEQLNFGELQLEYHCMTQTPDAIVASSLPVDRLIMHYELGNWRGMYDRLVRDGINVWIAIDPTTAIESLDLPEDVSGLVVMGVVPGQNGQPLVEGTFDRVAQLRDFFPDLPLTVDGGVNEKTVRQFLAAGADNMVAGSAIFHAADPQEAYARLAHLADPVGGAFDYKAARNPGE